MNITSKTFAVHNSDGVVYLTFPLISACGTVRHGFTTRFGGVSSGIYAAMNMSITGGDDSETVKENYRRICAALDIDPSHLVLAHQTHTDNLLCVTADDRGKGIWRERDFSDIDGLMTNERGVALVTQYADCTPLFFCDPVKKVIALSHAGWRGTVQKIGTKTVQKMVSVYGCRPEDILTGIGPSIGVCCYEVDTPVFERFHMAGFPVNEIFTDKGGGKYQLNLWKANHHCLLEAGILPEHIECTDLCTNCHPDVFHSHRFTGGKRGTLAAIMELR